MLSGTFSLLLNKMLMKRQHFGRKGANPIVMQDKVSFFLGSNTPDGFYSLFSDLYDPTDGWRCYILKGGPGTGKSTFMKRVAESASHCGQEAEVIHCASDPASLDAVILRGLKVCVADGTAPHVIEPILPGVSEQLVDLGEYWSAKRIRTQSERIIALNREYKSCHLRAVKFMKGAAVLYHDTARLIEEFTDAGKIESAAQRLSKRELPVLKNRTGTLTRRFLSAPTPEGMVFHTDTVRKLCKNVIGIEGFPSVSGKLLGQIADIALKRGHDVTVCPSFIDPSGDPAHVLIPTASTAFLTVDKDIPSGIVPDRLTHTARFTDGGGIASQRTRIRFNRRLYGELMQQAFACLTQARDKHGELEKLYMPAMDFKKCEKRCDAVIMEILGK